MARHWIRATPPVLLKRVKSLMEEDDDRWVNLLIYLAGVEEPSTMEKEKARAAIRAKLQHGAMVDNAELIATDGILKAIPPLQSAVAEIPMKWLETMSGKRGTRNIEELQEHLTTAKEALNKRLQQTEQLYHKRLGTAAAMDVYVDILTCAVPRATWPTFYGLPHRRGKSVLAYALAKTLQLPLWGVLGGQYDGCDLCGVPLQGPDAVKRPSQYLDHNLEHVHVCKRLPPRICTQAKHNVVARGCVGMATYAGIAAQYVSAPLWSDEAGGNDAPADWMEEGLAVDITIRSGAYKRTLEAEKEKERKYERHRLVDSTFKFTAAAISTSGVLAPDFKSHMKIWGNRLAAKRADDGDLIGQPHSEVRAAFGQLFATAMATQAFGWAEACERKKRNAESKLLFHGRKRETPATGRRADNTGSPTTPTTRNSKPNVPSISDKSSESKDPAP
jgi:hypothetical protein